MADKSKYTAYKNKFAGENYDRFSLILPKGKKETLQKCAAANGKSLNNFINEAIDERLVREGKGDIQMF